MFKRYKKYFDSLGTPANAKRIKDIEAALGRELPAAYRDVIKQTGGGQLAEKYCMITGIDSDNVDPEGIMIDCILGNGHTDSGTNLDLAEYAPFLMDEWDLPNGVLLCAISEDGMHQCFAINYELAEFAPLGVLYIDTDPDGEILQIADSFEDFLSMLAPHPDLSKEAPDYKGLAIEGVLHGPINEELRAVIDATGVDDLEDILRYLGLPMAKALAGRIEHDPKGKRFLDVLYWAVQHVQPHHSGASFFGWPDSEGNEMPTPNLSSMSRGSFVAPGGIANFNTNLGTCEAWFMFHEREGVLTKTEKGYILSDEYALPILEETRQKMREEKFG
ncbi:SMI1/KNR4 family protein [Corynebacterium sp. H128]|uniref:SMI1/KNR4 family protein n=1 Tax=Corynebacterium sp. H128 TaxID=3133427 RepID=UPI0030A5BE62